jgi:hypothetical protein
MTADFRNRFLAALAIVTSVFATRCGHLLAQGQAVQTAPVVHQEQLGVVSGPPPGIDRFVTSDGWRFACTIQAGGKQRVMVDGRLGPEYAGIEQVWFSSDGQHFAYVAQLGTRERVVLDGQPGAEYDQITRLDWPFSADGKHIAYAARDGNKWFAVADAAPGPSYDEITDFLTLPDGQAVYAARRGGKWMAVVQGQEGTGYDSVTGLQQSEGGRHLAYKAKRGAKWMIVEDGHETPEFDDVDFEFSPDGERLAYWAATSKKQLFGTGTTWHMTVDGQSGSEYDVVGMPKFSDDGKHFAYPARNGIRPFFVVDGRPQRHYDWVDDLSFSFSHNGGRSAYSVSDGNIFTRFFVVDGHADRSYNDLAWRAVFSPDGKHIAYGAMTWRLFGGSRWFVVEDGRPGPEYDRLSNIEEPQACTPIFSPDGMHLAYPARQGDKWFVVRDGSPGPKCDHLGYPDGYITFSPDSKHLAYFARIGRKSIVFLDDRPLPPCDQVACVPIFRHDGKLEYIAENDEAGASVFYRVTCSF